MKKDILRKRFGKKVESAAELRMQVIARLSENQYKRLKELESVNGLMPINMEEVSTSQETCDLYLKWLVVDRNESKRGGFKIIEGGNRWGQPSYEAKGKLKIVVG